MSLKFSVSIEQAAGACEGFRLTINELHEMLKYSGLNNKRFLILYMHGVMFCQEIRFTDCVRGITRIPPSLILSKQLNPMNYH